MSRSIEDSGLGFEAEPQANLFTPVLQHEPAHGFDYSLHKRPGEPTTFTIVF